MLKPLLWKKPCATRGELIAAVVVLAVVVAGIVILTLLARGM